MGEQIKMGFMRKAVMMVALTFGFCVLLVDLSSADPFAVLPGTGARGMAGAVTGSVNNTSALYYNPAGLIYLKDKKAKPEKTFTHLMTLEAGDAIEFDAMSRSDQFTSEAWHLFFAYSGKGEKWGWGVGYWEYYNATIPALSTANTTVTFRMDYGALPVALAYQLHDRIAVGIAGIFNMGNVQDKEMNLKKESVYGQTWMAGTQIRLWDGEAVKIDMGGRYREKSAMDYSEGITGLVSNKSLWDIPTEYAVGITSILQASWGAWTLAGDYKRTQYDSATDGIFGDVDTYAIGCEFRLPGYNIRVGAYQAEMQNMGTFELRDYGITAGIGTQIFKGYLEGAVDARRYDSKLIRMGGAPSTETNKWLPLYSLAYNFEF